MDSGRKPKPARNDATGFQIAPKARALPPHPRHGLTTFGPNHKPKDVNSLILPWVDVKADIDAINAGKGFHHPGTRQTWIHGRLYGMHGSGRTYPMRGEGIIPLSRETYRGLLIIRRYNGINERSERELGSHPALTDADREEARRIWRLREKVMSDERQTRD